MARQTCGVQTFDLIKLLSNFKQVVFMFHEMYLSYHGQILLKFETLTLSWSECSNQPESLS